MKGNQSLVLLVFQMALVHRLTENDGGLGNLLLKLLFKNIMPHKLTVTNLIQMIFKAALLWQELYGLVSLDQSVLYMKPR